MRVGVDTGGTFTDVVTEDGRIRKVPSTPHDPAVGVRDGLGDERPQVLAHGTTVATNALLERRGARIALIVNSGFADVIEIARQDRPSLYDLWADRPEPLVPRELRFEVGGRLDGHGREVEPFDPASVPELPSDVSHVAVCLLHADLNPAHEHALGAVLRARGIGVTLSSDVSPEFREYERTVTTVIDAYLRPACSPYLSSLDVHTIGAGGGSIARLDAGGALVVGPQSAGAVPGPACYGRGGVEATVTDADLAAGRIPSRAAFPGLGTLDVEAARAALARAGVTADGVIEVVDAGMTQAVRVVSIERGVDPRGLALVAFGGAGPLHACAIAEALGMAAVIVPPRAGVLSAVGILGAPQQVDVVRSWPTPRRHDGLSQGRFHLARVAARRLLRLPPDTPARVALAAGTGTAGVVMPDGTHVEVTLSVDCRYAGQSHELTVPTVADFEEEHERRNGYSRPGAPVEVVAVRASARLASPVDVEKLPLPEGVLRRSTAGPAVLAEPDCTVWVPQGWTAEVGGGGSWILRRSRS